MPNGKLRVLAKGTAQVPDYEKLAAGLNARVTHACLAIGPEFDGERIDSTGRVLKDRMRHAAFVKHVGQVLTVPDRAEYRRHLRDGDLWPADIETANECGVPFDPTFGGEHTPEKQSEHEAAVHEMKVAAGLAKPKPAAVTTSDAAPQAASEGK